MKKLKWKRKSTIQEIYRPPALKQTLSKDKLKNDLAIAKKVTIEQNQNVMSEGHAK